jgi:hypothetical protein
VTALDLNQRRTAMRDEVFIPYEEMDPTIRAMLTYERNGAFDVAEPQVVLQRLLRESPVVRWELGVGFFAMEDVLAGCKNKALVSNHPDTGRPFGMAPVSR